MAQSFRVHNSKMPLIFPIICYIVWRSNNVVVHYIPYIIFIGMTDSIHIKKMLGFSKKY